MASGEPESNHILLAVTTPLAEFLDTLAKSFEKFDVIYHAATFYFCLTRNTTSRLAASASDVGLLSNVGAQHFRYRPFSQLNARFNEITVAIGTTRTDPHAGWPGVRSEL
jgi:hypothetical protein